MRNAPRLHPLQDLLHVLGIRLTWKWTMPNKPRSHFDTHEVLRVPSSHGIELALHLAVSNDCPALGYLQLKAVSHAGELRHPFIEVDFRTYSKELEAFAADIQSIHQAQYGSARLVARDFEMQLCISMIAEDSFVVGGTVNTPQLLVDKPCEDTFCPEGESVFLSSFDGIIANQSYLPLVASNIYDFLRASKAM